MVSKLKAPRKLLFVDDNHELRKLLKLTFSYGKFLLFEARNGEEALEIVRHHKLDIIILDVMLPVLNGLQVCRQIRSMENGCGSYIIMLSGQSHPKDIQAGLASGADLYLTKPFELNQLISVIEKFLADSLPILDQSQKNGILMRLSDMVGKEVI